jgi:hypothetical protein
MASRRTFTERGTRGSRRRVLRRYSVRREAFTESKLSVKASVRGKGPSPRGIPLSAKTSNPVVSPAWPAATSRDGPRPHIQQSWRHVTARAWREWRAQRHPTQAPARQWANAGRLPVRRRATEGGVLVLSSSKSSRISDMVATREKGWGSDKANPSPCTGSGRRRG